MSLLLKQNTLSFAGKKRVYFGCFNIPDEVPTTDKNSLPVMTSQRELVDVLGSLTPKIVRMGGA